MIFERLERLFSQDFRRRRLLARAPTGPLRDYLATPFPSPDTPSNTLACLALDLETTGGDPARDEIVSFGWVCMDGERIDLASARHRIVQLRGEMSGESAAIHGITDDQCQSGCSLESALGELLAALAGRVMIAHHAETELGFVGRACETVYGGRILIPTVDTLRIAIRAETRRHRTPQRNALRLSALRQKYNLPRHHTHNALSDALAAAELFLAQQAEQAENGDVAPLRNWLFSN